VQRRGAQPDPAQHRALEPGRRQLILKLPRSSLESHLGDLLGRSVAEVVDFDFGLDLTHAPGQSLLNSVEFLPASSTGPGA
jgi:hypothetical protein